MAILGLGLGGAYALLTLGVVAIYRGTGVPNFAHGAVAMFSALVFFDLRDKHHLSSWVAAAAAIGTAVFAGVAFYWLVMRQLRKAPILARITATIGLLLLLHGLALSLFDVATRTPDPVLPDAAVSILGVTIPANRLILAGMAIALGLVLALVSTRTRLGLAVRAVADSEKGAQLTGLSPSVLGALTWGLGFALAAIVGIVLSPIAGLDADALTLLIVPVFGAALLARFNSFGLAVVGGLGIGMVQAILELFQGNTAWWSELWSGVGRTKAFPALIVILLIVLSGKLLPTRGGEVVGRLPVAPMPRYRRVGPVIALIVGGIFIFTASTPWLSAGVVSMGGAMIGLSIVVIVGFLGQISLAQFASAGIGGLITARLAEGLPLPLVVIAAGVGAAVVGVLLGLPSVRVRGQSLALVTLSATYICQTVVFEDARIVGSEFGFPVVKAPELFGSQLSPQAFALVVLVVVVAMGWFVATLRASSFGRRAIAVRENEGAAIAAGTNVRSYKLAGFALSSAMAGIAGSLMSYQALVFAPSSFSAFGSLNALVMGYIGGIAMVGGAIFAGIGASGGLFAQFLAVNGWTSAHELIGGLGLLIAIQLHPNGMVSLGHDLRQRRRRKNAEPEVTVETPVQESKTLQPLRSR